MWQKQHTQYPHHRGNAGRINTKREILKQASFKGTEKEHNKKH
jgi:hypothetical protein